MTFDLIIHGGRVIDGTGRPAESDGPGRLADVGVAGDRIVAIGDLLEVEANRRLDAAGCLVCPGFIDIHSHSDFTLLVDPRARSAVAQGVTTEVVGNCGHGCAPIPVRANGGVKGHRPYGMRAFSRVGGIPDVDTVRHNIYGYTPLVDVSWTDMDGYLDRLAGARPAVNVATLAPNGNLRMAAMGTDGLASGAADRPGTPEDIRRMVLLLEESLDAGAVGFSTGLEYPTERASGRDELLALCRAVARRGGFYATHTRNLDRQALDAIGEAIDLARATGVALQISHIIPRRAGRDDDWHRALELVDEARSSGVDVAFDAHTRVYGTTNLSMALPPGELAHRGMDLAARLRDPAVRAEIKRYPSLIAGWGLAGWDRAFLLSSPHRPEWVGKSFAELAGDEADGMDSVIEVLIADADDPHAPMAYSDSREEEWLLGTMRHPLCMIGSDATDLATDGPLADTVFLGAYTWAGWYLRRLVRETGILSWEQAIHRLTDLPAQRTGLAGRGRLEEGMFADIVVLDPERVRDRGTLEDPKRFAAGIGHVVVNGVPALEHAAFGEQRAGRVLRRDA